MDSRGISICIPKGLHQARSLDIEEELKAKLAQDDTTDEELEGDKVTPPKSGQNCSANRDVTPGARMWYGQ